MPTGEPALKVSVGKYGAAATEKSPVEALYVTVPGIVKSPYKIKSSLLVMFNL